MIAKAVQEGPAVAVCWGFPLNAMFGNRVFLDPEKGKVGNAQTLGHCCRHVRFGKANDRARLPITMQRVLFGNAIGEHRDHLLNVIDII